MFGMIFDPSKFYGGLASSHWIKPTLLIISISLAEITVVMARIAYHVPHDEFTPVIFGFLLGAIVRATVFTMVGLSLQFAVFWALSRAFGDFFSLLRQLVVFGYSLIPGLIGAAVTRSLIAVLAPGEMPLERLRVATSISAFIQDAPKYTLLLDPFLILSITLLAVGHNTMTDKKRPLWVSGLIAVASVSFTRIIF